MELTLTRIEKTKDYTTGRLDIDGTYFCDTLEPTWRSLGPGRPGHKIAGRTAIPDGRYPVVVTYSPRFGRWLPLLLHVPQFEGIRIHAGNTPTTRPDASSWARTAGPTRCSTRASGNAASCAASPPVRWAKGCGSPSADGAPLQE